jgi:hypothetical protein
LLPQPSSAPIGNDRFQVGYVAKLALSFVEHLEDGEAVVLGRAADEHLHGLFAVVAVVHLTA